MDSRIRSRQRQLALTGDETSGPSCRSKSRDDPPAGNSILAFAASGREASGRPRTRSCPTAECRRGLVGFWPQLAPAKLAHTHVKTIWDSQNIQLRKLELLGYHRKSAIRALRQRRVVRGVVILKGRPVTYEPNLLVPWLKPIWQATDYDGRLVLTEWVSEVETQEDADTTDRHTCQMEKERHVDDPKAGRGRSKRVSQCPDPVVI